MVADDGIRAVCESASIQLPTIAELAVFGGTESLVEATEPKKIFARNDQVGGAEKVEAAGSRLMVLQDDADKGFAHLRTEVGFVAV